MKDIVLLTSADSQRTVG